MRTKQVLLSILVMGTAGLVQGCLVAAVGVGAAGTIAYVRGDLEAVESQRLDVVYEATLKAVEKLQLSVTTKSKDAMSAVIVARDAQDKKVTIALKAVTEEATKLYIRVGVFGSETKSRLIYQEIHESLPR
jgi:endo-beta-N-acetylglucosaminidase D